MQIQERTASLVNGILRLTYHESILQDSIKAYIVILVMWDNAVDGKSVVEGLTSHRNRGY